MQQRHEAVERQKDDNLKRATAAYPLRATATRLTSFFFFHIEALCEVTQPVAFIDKSPSGWRSSSNKFIKLIYVLVPAQHTHR